MAKNRRADKVLFGFDFQVNAAIVLMLENIKELKSLRLEGNYEDIDIVLDDGNHILAQAKAVVNSSSDFSHVRSNIKKALLSLSEASKNVDAKQLIFITNSPNPLNDMDSRNVFYGNAKRSFDSLPPSAKSIITNYLSEIDDSLDTKKFLIRVFPFETDDDQERYKVVLETINDFIGSLNLNHPGLGKKLMCAWQNEAFENSTKKDSAIVISKKKAVWQAIVIITDIDYCDSDFAEYFDASLYNEIIHRYHDVIDSCCERCDFFVKVLCDYKHYESSESPSKKCRDFAMTKWEDYVDEIEAENISEETQKGLIQIILYSIVRNRIEIDKRYSTRVIATVRNILAWYDNKYDEKLMDKLISAVAETILVSKEGISTKLDAISLLICIVLKYPEDYVRNQEVFEKIFAQREDIDTSDHGIFSSNMGNISLKIGLEFLYVSMGKDMYSNIVELMPYIGDNIAATTAVCRLALEYLELGDDVKLPDRVEDIMLQYVLQWLHSENLDVRGYATRVLLTMVHNADNYGILNKQLISLIDTDGAYVKNLIIRNLYRKDGITDDTRDYIFSKCKHDANYVVRMVCDEVEKGE